MPLDRIAPDINSILSDDSEYESQLLNTLEDAYTKARYNPDFEVSKETASLLFERVKLIE